MPIVDMPLAKLREYQGVNPRPKDFDEFWNESLDELYTIDPSPKFEPYDFPCAIADAYKLTITATRGARIYAKFLKPKSIVGKAPAVLVFHGLSGSSPEWNDAIKFVAQGYVVAMLDTRGQGGYSEDVGGVPGTTYATPFMRGFDGEPKDLLCRDLFLDTAALARVVMALDYVDETRVAATGGSQGGALTLACAALTPSLNRAAPIHPFLCDYKRVWEMDLAMGAYEGLRYYFRWFDPAHEREDEIFEKLGYIDIQFLAPRIRAKVMMATCLMDTTCPPSTQFAMYNKVTAKKNVVFFPEYGHEGLKGASDMAFEFLSDL